MKFLQKTLLLSALLFPSTVQAQSFYPNLSGARYCQLRSMGVEQKRAIGIAISENWSNTRKPVWVTINGERVNLDAVDMARWAARCQ